MGEHPDTASTHRQRSQLLSLTHRPTAAFKIGGSLLAGSLVVPPLLTVIIPWSWVLGLILAGGAVVMIAVGVVGLYPRMNERTPGLAVVGTAGAVIAGVCAVILIGTVGFAAIVGGLFGVTFPRPTGAFVLLSLVMATGLGSAFVLSGLALTRNDHDLGVAGALLAGGGGVVVVATLGEVSRAMVGISPPRWILFLVLGLLVVDSLAVGYALHPVGDSRRPPSS
ncbi:MAG: hypothetical protein SVG88_11200 [Halobacteriales archaeon]|nr:hypothetical protein [Halobacteriales archaeon]